jgi:hypothetical protein
VRLVAFEPAHLLRLRPGAREQALFEKFGVPTGIDGPAFTVIEGGHVLGCGGLIQRAPQSPLAWVLLSDALRRRPVLLHRLARRLLARMAARQGEIAASLDPGDAPARRWAERLGFRFAGILPAYGPEGEAYWRYVYMSGMETYATAAMFGLDTVGKIAQMNAQRAEMRREGDLLSRSAEQARQLAALQAARAREAGDRALAARRARLAASGVDPAAGSGLLTRESVAGDNEFDALLAGADSLASADRYDQQAALQSMRLRAARIGGLRSLMPNETQQRALLKLPGLLSD